MSNPSRHEQLIAAGWRYHATDDLYEAPGSATDGTAKRYNLNAAWEAEQRRAAGDMPATGLRETQSDPRRQEPQ